MIKKIKKNKKGFTLIELIVVIAIIAILAAVAVPNYIAVQNKAEENAILGNAAIIAQAINAHNALVPAADKVTAVPAYADFNTSISYVPITMAAADFVVEAAVEMEELKFNIFRELDAACPEQVILSTNTSSIPIGRIAAQTNRPEKIIGMHFMNPVPIMKLVEVIRGLATSQETFDITWQLCEKFGKTAAEANDYPGFIANRILMPMINEAIFCLYQGVGKAEDIDTVMRLGMNHPMGPLALADLIGLDTCLAIMETLYDGFKDSKYRPCPLLRKYVEAGWFGRKSGKGFYDY